MKKITNDHVWYHCKFWNIYTCISVNFPISCTVISAKHTFVNLKKKDIGKFTNLFHCTKLAWFFPCDDEIKRQCLCLQ